MRITKRIEAYVHEEVAKKYEGYDKAEYDKWDAARKTFEDACNDAAMQADAMIKKCFPEFFVGVDSERKVITTSTYFTHNPFFQEYKKKRDEKNALIDEKVRSILLQIELGCTKDDLDKMLKVT